MTIIVYDNKSLITDSLTMVVNEDTADQFSYHSNKIRYNASRTVAFAYPGVTMSAEINTWMMRHAEAELVYACMQAGKAKYGEKLTVVSKFLDGLEELISELPCPPSKDGQGIAISKHEAIQFGSAGKSVVTNSLFVGTGCYLEAYWMLRASGMHPVPIMNRLSQIGKLVGGPINIQRQQDLNDPDYERYVQDLFNGVKYKDLNLHAVPKTPTNRKAKNATLLKKQ